ncbi:hypothetical protein MAPG_05285 [Magnaporthiopsis poae ATCC 64411]|uniref:Ion transport domain-containing protein n=1 Tax=Magnaporthiopsis poae (strain ATCC 64411 / 73-15) TaxID=644358 RepID=A0A0C4DYZ8_MAGP6|nr:hypothetical protein MAPG_05285 [Magnaporthiopsis poae ATCC 64411]
MIPRLLRPFVGARRSQEEERTERPPSPGPASPEYARRRHATADFTEADDDDDDDDDSNDEGTPRAYDRRQDGRGHEDDRDEDGSHPHSGRNLLPLFSASQLDSLPVYSITHAIRILVQARTETTLTWEQLRSPQVSQFLLKPMQLQIRTQHFSKATLYALMANCLQFQKEGHMYPGNAGASSTRAKVCELLAIKLLKEYSTRELIDALSYDFYPLQGLPGGQTPLGFRDAPGRPKSAAARTSTLEVAIRASAKHFLSHPLVVQQLEAIWNGAIVFYSAADSLHRTFLPASGPTNAASAGRRRSQADVRTPLLAPGVQAPKESLLPPLDAVVGRRTVSLYNPRNASLFKLSRLRVPRYRQFLSTLSLAVLIGLFLAVLQQRSSRISTLELVFWFWSAGFMLDELVGFNEQGFSLYIMSFWNIFDLGILLLLIVYYCLRLYGVFLIDARRWNDLAYDILAANGILLLPRIFSVLDHYQYFSQLLIAFRLMALDLAAVLVLVMICCSGFFVFFTMSKNSGDSAEVAYKIFQIVMGFTPAAWEVWAATDALGKVLMGFFLIICHFVIVTILITVLTNSFMTIASNAKEEHQFLFAINTISMVKNDALFSYIAPGNILAWFLTPLRYCMPMRLFVALNRYVIKLTHFPLLFVIYFYERFLLAPSMYAPTDLVENPGRSRRRAVSLADPASRVALFSPNVRNREESVTGYQKDHALEEVFRRVPDMGTFRTQRRNERKKTQTAIRHWMDQNEGFADPMNNYSTMGNKGGIEWQRRLSIARDRPPRRFPNISEVRSVASDPADLASNAPYAPFDGPFSDQEHHLEQTHFKETTDGDGDDELVTNDEDEEDKATNNPGNSEAITEDYFTTPVATRFGMLAGSSPESVVRDRFPHSPRQRKALHSRTLSSNTILYNPQAQELPPDGIASTLSSPPRQQPQRSRPASNRQTPAATPSAGQHSPRRSVYHAARPRPIVSPRELAHTAPSNHNQSSSRGGSLFGLTLDTHARRAQRRLSSFDMHLDGSSDVGGDGGGVSSRPSSRQSMRDGRSGLPLDLKGKGKEVRTPAEYDDYSDEDTGLDDSFTRRSSL